MKVLLIGVVGKAHGLKGEVTVHAFNAASPLWSRGRTLVALPPSEREGGATDSEAAHVEMAPGSGRSLEMKLVRRVPGDLVLVAFAGIADRNQAESLRNWRLAVDPSELPDLADDELYHHEVVGWEAVAADGTVLGRVEGMMPLPAQDVLQVKTSDGREVLVPFVAAIVKGISRAERRIVLDPPVGLFNEEEAEEAR
jgi:16S rRNA processing protein RimM